MTEELTGQAALAAKLAAVIHEFCEDLPWTDSERIGNDAAGAAWDCGAEPTCGAWGGCPQPVGHNRGRADVPENHWTTEALADAERSANFWKGLAEYWEREHDNTVLPYTNQLETERDALRSQLDRIRAIAEEAPEPRGALRRRLLAVLNGTAEVQS